MHHPAEQCANNSTWGNSTWNTDVMWKWDKKVIDREYVPEQSILRCHSFICSADEQNSSDCFWIKVFEGVITVFDLCVAAINVPDDNIIFRSTTEDETISHHPKRHGRHITMVTSEFKGRLQETLTLDLNVNFNFWILCNNVVLLNVTNNGTHFTVILNGYFNSFYPQTCKLKCWRYLRLFIIHIKKMPLNKYLKYTIFT